MNAEEGTLKGRIEAILFVAGEAVSVALKEPGGTLVVESDPEAGETWLFGGTKLRDQLTLKLT